MLIASETGFVGSRIQAAVLTTRASRKRGALFVICPARKTGRCSDQSRHTPSDGSGHTHRLLSAFTASARTIRLSTPARAKREKSPRRRTQLVPGDVSSPTSGSNAGLAIKLLDELRANPLKSGADARTRTGTALSDLGILSPLRLPFRHVRVATPAPGPRG